MAAVHPGDDFTLAVDGRVVEQLNRLRGTPDGRAFMRTSLQRMQEHEALIVGALGSIRPACGTDGGAADVWQIVDQGYENDPDYLARVMAALLIMKNPTVLE